MKLTKQEIEIITTALESYKSEFTLLRGFKTRTTIEIKIDDLLNKLKK